MTKFKRTLIAAFLMIGVAVIALTGTTYAWFVQGTGASVQSFNAQAVKVTGVSASWDALNFDSILNFDDESYLAAYTQIADEAGSMKVKNLLAPVSTAASNYNPTNGLLKFYTAELTSDQKSIQNATEVAHSTGKDGQFIWFDVYFKVEGDEESITLELSSVGLQGTDNIAIATRMAVINHGAVARGTYSDEDWKAEAQQLTADDNTALKIYEPNALAHKQTGINNGASTTSKTDYQGIIGAFTVLDNSKLENVNTVTDLGELDLELSTGINKVSFYFWIEGQDVDCNNDVQGGTFNISLTFNKKATQA